MNKRTVIIAALTLALVPQSARPDGMMLPRREPWKQQRERALINEPSQKAVLFYRNGREQLIISPSYQGPPGDFAWVVPVPSRPQVKILHGALFHELARVVEPAPTPSAGLIMRGLAPGSAAHRASVVVLERKTVGAYDVSVLSATDGSALQRWLDQNGYALPERAKRPLAGYIQEKWTFVACRVKAPSEARGLQQGVLAPLSLTFPTTRLVYPMRLSSVNPRPFALLLYLLRPSSQSAPQAKVWPGLRPPQVQAASVSPTASYGNYPSLGGFGVKTLNILWIKTTVAPQDCRRDYVWTFNGVRR